MPKANKRKVDQLNLEQCKIMLETGASTEEILKFLRGKGYSQGISVYFLMQLGLGDSYTAKKAVIFSKVWHDQFDANIEIQTSLDQFLDDP